MGSAREMMYCTVACMCILGCARAHWLVAAQVMVRSLFVPNARNRAFDLVSEDKPRANDAEVDKQLEGFKGKTDYGVKLPEPKSAQ